MVIKKLGVVTPIKNGVMAIKTLEMMYSLLYLRAYNRDFAKITKAHP